MDIIDDRVFWPCLSLGASPPPLFFFSPWPGPMCCDEPTLSSGVALTMFTSLGLFFLYGLKRGKQLFCSLGSSSIQPDKNLQKCNSVHIEAGP